MLFQPEINLKLGTYYLKTLLDQQDGSWEQTLASYNAGKRHADEWATWATFREPSEYIETIPFTETRNYIQIVLRNAHVYRRLYAPSAP
jgi:soluble lytic murein transglycosylase